MTDPAPQQCVVEARNPEAPSQDGAPEIHRDRTGDAERDRSDDQVDRFR
jgi:hypothetical protein